MLLVWNNQTAKPLARRLKIYLTFLQEEETGLWQPLLLFLPQMNECWELGLQHQGKHLGQTECSALVE